MEYRHENDKREVLVRLMKLQREQQPEEGKPQPRPAPPRPPVPPRKSPGLGLLRAEARFREFLLQ